MFSQLQLQFCVELVVYYNLTKFLVNFYLLFFIVIVFSFSCCFRLLLLLFLLSRSLFPGN